MHLRNIKWMSLIFVLALSVMLLPMQVFAATHVPVTGVSVDVNDSSSDKISNGTVTVTAKGSGGIFGYGASSKTTTITIHNTSASSATISFDWTATKVYQLVIDGSAVNATSGSFSKPLKGNRADSVVITITTDKNSTENKLVMNNFSIVEAKASSKVTLVYDESLGSVTVDGVAVANGGEVDVGNDGTAFVATPKSGISFLGWIDNTSRQRISGSASATIPITEDTTYHVAFGSAQTPAWFIKGSEWYDDLNKAIEKSGSGDTIIPAADGTLPAGNYTIPSGVTLLIPFDNANTLYTTEPGLFDYNPEQDTFNTYGAKVYRTLTMASGANIRVNGAISVSATQSATYGSNGSPIKEYGLIQMNSGSKITVENGAKLYAWGYITGSGSVEIKSGGEVRECFQIADFRGGNVTSDIVGKDDDYGVFPFNQYYLQNVEVPITLHAGAKEFGFSSITVSVAGHQKLSVPFIGSSDSMFVITSGHIVKDYMEGTGRTKIEVHGDMNITEISMKMRVSLLGTVTIETAKYALPIPHHFTVSVESGSINMNQSVAFLPGSEFTVKEGTTCTLGKDKKVYIYDWDQWLYNNGANGYSGTGNSKYVKLPYVPGGNGTTGREKDAQIQIDGTVDTSAGSVYVTAGGANVFSTGTGVIKATPGADQKTYQVTTNGNTVSSWPEIAILPAILQNADGTYVETAIEPGTYTYYASKRRWDRPSHFYDEGNFNEENLTTTYTCEVCGHKYSRFHFYGANVSLGNNLNMMFAFPKAAVENWDGYQVRIERTYSQDKEGNTAQNEITNITYGTDWTTNGDYWVVTYTGFNAKEMCDTVTLTVLDPEGNAVSETWTDSMRGYAMRMLEKAESGNHENLRAVIVDMLNYGAAAQNNFGYGIATLANALLTDVQKGYASEPATAEDDLPADTGDLKCNLSLESNIQFKISLDGLTGDETATISYTGHKENEVYETVELTTEGENTKYFLVPDIVVADARYTIIITVGENICYDSIAAYTARMLEGDYTDAQKAAARAFLTFADSAHTYLHNRTL